MIFDRDSNMDNLGSLSPDGLGDYLSIFFEDALNCMFCGIGSMLWIPFAINDAIDNHESENVLENLVKYLDKKGYQIDAIHPEGWMPEISILTVKNPYTKEALLEIQAHDHHPETFYNRNEKNSDEYRKFVWRVYDTKTCKTALEEMTLEMPDGIFKRDISDFAKTLEKNNSLSNIAKMMKQKTELIQNRKTKSKTNKEKMKQAAKNEYKNDKEK